MIALSKSLHIEPLERRTHLSSIRLSQGLLAIQGQPNFGDTIVVDPSADGTNLNVSVSWVNHAGKAQSLTRSIPMSRPPYLITIHGGQAGNLIEVDPSGLAFSIPTRIWGGAGNDTILTGSEDDTIRASNGTDMIQSGQGDDRLFAGPGNDTIIAGDGHDSLIGGGGHGMLYAGTGGDRVLASHGHDTLVGGGGPDLFYVASQKRTPIENYLPGIDRIRSIPVNSGSSDSTLDDILDALFI